MVNSSQLWQEKEIARLLKLSIFDFNDFIMNDSKVVWHKDDSVLPYFIMDFIKKQTIDVLKSNHRYEYSNFTTLLDNIKYAIEDNKQNIEPEIQYSNLNLICWYTQSLLEKWYGK